VTTHKKSFHGYSLVSAGVEGWLVQNRHSLFTTATTCGVVFSLLVMFGKETHFKAISRLSVESIHGKVIDRLARAFNAKADVALGDSFLMSALCTIDKAKLSVMV